MTLNDLSKIEKAHWMLHLNAALKDNPSLKTEIDTFLKGGELPNLKHPSSIHDWLEKGEDRWLMY